jgi:putative phosphoserine phosphatase / 1-acylglycerol-3-phosphate O-acyltransferase
MSELVIFDLDGVIINGQSQQIFLNYLFRKKIVGLFFYLKILFWFVLYKMGLVKNPKKIMEYAFAFLKSKKTEDVEIMAGRFFDENLKKFIFPEIVDIINKHKLSGRELLIVSNAADFIVKKTAGFLGIKNYVGTKLEIVNGIFTGRISGDITYGKNKVKFAEDFIKKNNLDLKNSFAYADHISDLDLLLIVKNPVAVNPDRALFLEAKKRNWRILNFKK